MIRNKEETDASISHLDAVSDIDQRNKFNNFDNDSSIGGGESQYGLN